MAEKTKTEDCNDVLYELHVHSEWVLDYDGNSVKQTHSHSGSHKWSPLGFTSSLNPWNLFHKQYQFPEELVDLIQSKSSWQFCVSLDGKVAAILQENILEVRTSRDEYCSVVGKVSIPPDSKPNWRKMCWSSDNSILAVAYSCGTIALYDLLASNIATIPPTEESKSTSQSEIAELIFFNPKIKNTKWSSELLVVHYNGIIESYFVSAFDGYQENIKFNCSKYYTRGVVAASYLSEHHVLVLSGFCRNVQSSGLSVWRLLTDSPYLKMAVEAPDLKKNSSLLSYLPRFSSKKNSSLVLKMRTSLDGQMLACIHSHGAVSVWHLPNLRLHKYWHLFEQPDHHLCVLQAGETVKSEPFFYPVDVDWWSDQVLIIARRSGSTSVCSISNLKNLLGDSPEFLSGPPQITAVRKGRPAFLALECEVTKNKTRAGVSDESDVDSEVESETSVLQANIQAALYSFTDMERFEPKRKPTKLVQKTYRLIGLKSTTPEELYLRKIDNEEYENALTLANQYNLDTDLVYQRQWRISNVSTSTIDNYLSKVKKISWVVSECVERVPDTLTAAKSLLEFGLNVTSFDSDNTKLEQLDSEQLELVSHRRRLFLYLDNLNLYERIIDTPANYIQEDYKVFRERHPLVSTLKFAHDENWQAVTTMLTYKCDQLLQYRLVILSNFPETMQPIRYRSLLPELVGDEVVEWDGKILRFPDWSEHEQFTSLTNNSRDTETGENMSKHVDGQVKKFITSNLTCGLLTEWYRWRTYDIEQRSLLIDNALSFVKLARERNVKDLDDLLCNLLTLETLVYDVRRDDVTLTKLQSLTCLDQAKLLLSRITMNSLCDDMKNYLLPFLLRVEKQNNVPRTDILRGLLLEWSHTSLTYPLKFFEHLRDDSFSTLQISVVDKMKLALECLYSCESTDELENSYSILECLPDRENGVSCEEEESLHSRVDMLEKHLSVCEVLSKNNTATSVKYVRDNENNLPVARELMEKVADYVRKNTMDFSYLLDDLLDIQSNCFKCLSINDVYEVYAMAKLTCENEEIIQSAEQVLTCHEHDVNKYISLDKSVGLVLQAAREHFDKAANVDDPCLKYSLTCLKLIRQSVAEIHEELDLIEALQLLGDYQVKMLPVQVRICPDRMKLIDACLKSHKKAYKSCERLLQLAQSLRICGEDRVTREGQVLSMVATHSLNIGDYQHCSEICSRLINNNYKQCWRTVQSLAECDNFHNLQQKQTLLAFTILHAPIEHVERLIELRIKLRTDHESAILKTRNIQSAAVS